MLIPKKIVIDFTNKPYDKMNTKELAQESNKIKNVYDFLEFYKSDIVMVKSEKESLINNRKGSLIAQEGTSNLLTIYSSDYLRDEIKENDKDLLESPIETLKYLNNTKEEGNQYETLISLSGEYDYNSLFREVEQMYIKTSSMVIKQMSEGEITFDMESEVYDENDVQEIKTGHISFTNSGFYIGADGYGNNPEHFDPLVAFDYYLAHNSNNAELKIVLYDDPHSEDPNRIINLENMRYENIKHDMEDILYEIIALPQEHPKYFDKLLKSKDFNNAVDKNVEEEIVSQIIKVIKKNGIEDFKSSTSTRLLKIVDMYNNSEFINSRTNEMCKNTVDAIQSIFEKFEKTGKENNIEKTKTNHTIDN